MCNTPIKMIYKPSEIRDTQEDVLVYDITHTHDTEGTLVETYVLAWVPRTSSWLTAPIWAFTPAIKKSLTEEVL